MKQRNVISEFPNKESKYWLQPGHGVSTLVSVTVGMLAVAFVFRNQIGNGFSILLSDPLDGVIQTSIMQHWHNVFHGLERWDTTAYFYPYPDTLGYNDGFFLQGVLLTFFRALGADPFLASDLGSIVIRLLGFFAFELFVIEVLAFGLGWALLGATVFTLSNNIFVQSHHAQILTVSLAPLLAWLLWRTLLALRARSNASIGWGCAAAALYGVWLMSGFYMAWFMLLFLTLVVLAAAAQEVIGRGVGWSIWYEIASWRLVPIAVGLAICSLPFVFVYLPKAKITGLHRFSDLMEYSPSIFDLMHIGSKNFLFGAFDQWLTHAMRPSFPDYGEHTIGFLPLIIILACMGIIQFLLNRLHSLLMRSIAIATTLSFILVVHFGPHSLWYLVYAYFPGGSAVRVVARYPLFLTFPVILLAVSFLRATARRIPFWLVAPLCVLLVTEEVTSYNPTGLDRQFEVAALATKPLPECQAFFVREGIGRPPYGDPVIDSLYPHNVSAMMLAELLALPTINGFATFKPPDWNFALVKQPEYLRAVDNYLNVHKLSQGICSVDLGRKIWKLESVEIP